MRAVSFEKELGTWRLVEAGSEGLGVENPEKGPLAKGGGNRRLLPKRGSLPSFRPGLVLLMVPEVRAAACLREQWG